MKLQRREAVLPVPINCNCNCNCARVVEVKSANCHGNCNVTVTVGYNGSYGQICMDTGSSVTVLLGFPSVLGTFSETLSGYREATSLFLLFFGKTAVKARSQKFLKKSSTRCKSFENRLMVCGIRGNDIFFYMVTDTQFLAVSERVVMVVAVVHEHTQ